MKLHAILRTILITLAFSASVFATDISISSTAIPWTAPTSNVELRLFLSAQLVTPEAQRYPASSVSTGVTTFKWDCTYSAGNLTLPAIVLPATTNAVGGGRVRWTAVFFNKITNTAIQNYSGYEYFQLPHDTTPTTWSAIKTWNDSVGSAQDMSRAYTRGEVESRLATKAAAAEVAAKVNKTGDTITGPIFSTSTITARTFDNGGRVFDVRARGASPLNTGAQNLTYIQATIDAASEQGGGDVLVNDGVYKVSGQLLMESNVRLLGNGTIKADDNTSYESVVLATNESNVFVESITVDANRAGRSSATIRSVGVYLNSCTGCVVERVTVRNVYGYSGIVGIGIAVAGVSTDSQVVGCQVYNSGAGAQTADAFYTSSSKTRIIGCLADTATDTGFVVESASNAMIVDCIAINCVAGAAISNASGIDTTGNMIDGLIIRNWGTAITGGLYLGTIGSGAGNLLNTTVSDVSVVADAASPVGVGPAIQITKGSGAGTVIGMTLDNVNVNGSDRQALAITAGSGIKVNGGSYKIAPTTGGAAAITVQGSASVDIFGATLEGGQFGLSSTSTASVRLRNCVITGWGSYAAYAFDTSSITANYNNLATGGVAQFGNDGGATMQESFNLALNGLDYAGSGDVRHRDITARLLRIAQNQYLSSFAGATPVALLGVTTDTNPITRYRAAVDAGGYQWTNQAGSTSWISLLAAGLTVNVPANFSTLTANRGTYLDGSKNLGTSGSLQFTSGTLSKAGIGTASPNYPLEVNSGVTTTSHLNAITRFYVDGVSGLWFGYNVAASTGYIGAVTDGFDHRDLTLSPLGGAVVTGGMVRLGGIAFASLGTPANGTIAYCSDCTKATPCAGAGSGALAKRLNGSWDCD